MSIPVSAASAAANAMQDLLHFAVEGELLPLTLWYDDIVLQLADALRLTLEHAATTKEAATLDTDGRDLADQLQAAVARFLEDWR